jgi:hypothetical protein
MYGSFTAHISAETTHAPSTSISKQRMLDAETVCSVVDAG